MSHSRSLVRRSRLPCALLFVLALSAPTLADVRYVDDDAAPGGNGQTWATAYDEIADAIFDQQATEIRVADGTYEAENLPLRDGLAIIGGYGGETVLDSKEVSRRFVADGADNVRLQRLSIVNAEDGAMRLLNGGSFTIRDCKFTGNDNFDSGGAIYAINCAISMIGCDFAHNRSHVLGGSVSVEGGRLTMLGCDFEDSRSFSGWGGAVFLDDYPFGGDQHLILGCRFSNCGAEGGGALGTWSARVAIIGCQFTNNEVWYEDGGAATRFFGDSRAVIIGCRFTGNQYTWGGSTPGGIVQASHTTQAALFGCHFSGNTEPLTLATQQAVITVWP